MSEHQVEVEVEEIDVKVVYNGVTTEITVKPEETLRQLLDRAIQAFSPIPQPHLLALFPAEGPELNESLTVRQAGIHDESKLLLRPSAVRGG
jgi:uncharacterized protein DUF2604